MQLTPYRFLTTTDGILLRYGYWPRRQKGLEGTLVLLGGRTEFLEKYCHTISRLNHRGFDVFSIDWRGQGLSGRLLKNPYKGHVDTYQDYIADLDQFMRTIVLPRSPSPLVLLAHSMGGNIVLQYLGQHALPVGRVVLTAPLIRIKISRLTELFGRFLSRWMTRFGWGAAAVPSLRRRHTFQGPFENNGLTSDPQRFYAIQRMIAENWHFNINSVTYGWIEATFEAIDHIHAPGFARNITAPVLLAIAENDTLVCNRAIYRFAAGLPQHHVITIIGANHEILQEKEKSQIQFWGAFDAFVLLIPDGNVLAVPPYSAQ
jgi:lysophospholipase